MAWRSEAPDKERISSLEALQEDTFYTTENFVNTMGNLEAGRAINYAGRIIPIVHRSEDGQDGGQPVLLQPVAQPHEGEAVEPVVVLQRREQGLVPRLPPALESHDAGGPAPDVARALREVLTTETEASQRTARQPY